MNPIRNTAKSSSPPPSPKRASRLRAYGLWLTADSCACRNSRRATEWDAWKRSVSRLRPRINAADAPDEPPPEHATVFGARRKRRAWRHSTLPKFSKQTLSRSFLSWQNGACGRMQSAPWRGSMFRRRQKSHRRRNFCANSERSTSPERLRKRAPQCSPFPFIPASDTPFSVRNARDSAARHALLPLSSESATRSAMRIL